MKKLSLLSALIVLLCGCHTSIPKEYYDGGASGVSSADTSAETSYETVFETSEAPDDSDGIIDEKTMAKIEAIVKLLENQPEKEYYIDDKHYTDRLTVMKEWIKWKLNYMNDALYLKELNCDFNGDENMDEIIEILLNRNKVCFKLYFEPYSIDLLADSIGNAAIDGGFPIINYLFDNYGELKEFVEGTYTSEYSDLLLYEDGRNSPYYDYNGFLMCDSEFFGFIYCGPGGSECIDGYKITNVTDDTCEFDAYLKWYYDYENDDNYVIFDVECTAVKENAGWRLTEDIGDISGYIYNEDGIYRDYGTGEKDFVPFETYKVPR